MYSRVGFRHYFTFVCSALSVFFGLALLITGKFLSYKLRYGMDIRGGVCLTFTTKDSDIASAINSDLLREIVELRDDKNLPIRVAEEGGYIVVESAEGGLEDPSRPRLPYMPNVVVMNQGNRLVLKYQDHVVGQKKSEIMSRILDVTTARIEDVDTRVYLLGDKSITVEVPGVYDTEAIRNRIGQLGKVWFEVNGNRQSVGGLFRDVYVAFENGMPQVHMVMNSSGAKIVRKLTANPPGRMRILLENETGVHEIVAPDFSGQMSDKFYVHGPGEEESRNLALIMRSGALPIPMYVAEENLVGPTLGNDQVRYGVYGVIGSMILVAATMMFVYGWLGLVVNLALLVNVMILILFLAISGLALTLPGICGIALTIGTAVDANIIINEAIKKFLAEGKSWRLSVQSGYESASPTIFNSNVTTFIGMFVIYVCSSGPIQGFAITYLVGLLISMFTALWLTRLILDVKSS